MTDAITSSDRIERRGDKYVLLSQTGEVLGTHETEEEARAQERAIEASKRAGDSVHLKKNKDAAHPSGLECPEGSDDPRCLKTEDGLIVFFDTCDVASISVATRDASGFLRVNATVTAPGVYAYVRDGHVRHELKPPEEIFAPLHMESVHGAVVTDGHPPNANAVTPENANQFQRGHSRSAPIAGASGMELPLVVTDGMLIEDIEHRRKTGVSLGLRNTFDPTPGVWTADDGSKHPYDGIQRNMVTNHIAIVVEPRVTSAQLHLDSLEQDGPIQEQDTHMEKQATLTIDGADFEIDANVASIVNAAMGRQKSALAVLQTKLDEATSSYDSLTEEKDKLVVERDTAHAERDAAKEKLATSDAVDVNALADERLAFLEKAQKVLKPDKFKEVRGQDEAAIMKFTCDAHGIDTADKSEGYVQARFDMLVEGVTNSNDDKFINASVNPGSAPEAGEHETDINKRLVASYDKMDGRRGATH